MSIYRTKALHKQFSENAQFKKFPVTQYEIYNYAQLLLFYPHVFIRIQKKLKPKEAKVFSAGSPCIKSE